MRTGYHLDQEEDRIWGGGRENCLQYPQPKQCLPLPQENRQRGGWEEGEGGQERGEFEECPPRKFNDWPNWSCPCSEDSAESKRLILNMHNTPKVLLPCNEILNE